MTSQDVVCPTCGAAIKPIAGRLRALFKQNLRLARTARVLNLTIVVIVIVLYIVFALPRATVRSIKATTNDVMMVSVGYTSLPLHSIAAIPTTIPRLNDAPGNAIFSRPGYTEQFTVYAIYKNLTTVNATTVNVTRAP